MTPNAHARGALARSADQALLQPVAHASSQDQGAAVQSSASDMEKSAERVVGQHDEAKKIKNGVRAAVKELCVLHDIPEAIQRLREMAIPAEYQAGELAHILAQVAEEGNQGSRSVCFNFVVQLFVDCVFSKSELQPGLDRFFFKSFDELFIDMPALPRIMRDEAIPTLEELVRTELLAAEQHAVYARRVM